jgi:hypothetical protein
MAEVQGVVYVQSGVSLAAEQNDRLPVCYDTVCMLGIRWNGGISRSVDRKGRPSVATTLTSRFPTQTMSRSRL